MRVMITRSSGPKFWYSTHIGEIFHVFNVNNKGKHRVDHEYHGEYPFLKSGFFINSEDCCPVNDQIESVEDIELKNLDLFNFICPSCEWIFKSMVGATHNCPYCDLKLKTGSFSESDTEDSIGHCIVINNG